MHRQHSERLPLAPGWGSWVDSGDTSEGDLGGEMGSLLYGVLSQEAARRPFWSGDAALCAPG